MEKLDGHNAAFRLKLVRQLKKLDWIGTGDLARALGEPPGATRLELDRMLEARLAVKAPLETGFVWALTALGRLQNTDTDNIVPPRRIAFSKESYVPPSMAAARSGADDYLKLPSLVAGERVMP